MKLINQSAEYLPQGSGIEGIYKAIELAGRTSYLSWDKMTDDSAKKFVDMLIKSRHLSCLEHGTVYLYNKSIGIDDIPFLQDNPYTKINCIPSSETNIDGTKQVFELYTTTNLRVLLENNCIFLLEHICEPTEFHEKRLSVKVITDIGVTREFNRHRTFSIVEQSTRYCNFSKDKFNNEITVVIPVWCKSLISGNSYDMTIAKICGESEGIEPMEQRFLMSNCFAEEIYMEYLEDGWSPQTTRQVLPLCTKTEAFYTAFESDWRHFFDLRLFGKTGEPHPQIKQLAELIKQEFEKAGVWEGIMKYPSKFE